MTTLFKIYKGNSVVAEGASPLAITGLPPSTKVAKGAYKATKIVDGKESKKIDIPAFTTLSDPDAQDMLPIGQAVIGKSNKVG